MDEIFRYTLFISVGLNLLFFALGITFISKRGGIWYLLTKIPILNTKFRRAYLYYYYQYKKNNLNTLQNSKAEVVFLGDSLSANCEWSNFFPNQEIKNLGIGGDTTDGILNRIDDIIKYKPQKLFLLIGINDLYYGKRVGYIINNYRLILETLKKQSPQTIVFVQSLLPVRAPSNKVKTQSIVELNGKIKSLANEFSFNYIELFPAFLDSNRELDKRYTTDGVHLNGEGYLVWKRMIEKDIVN
jgi:lysophospholipase L1-like esterase